MSGAKRPTRGGLGRLPGFRPVPAVSGITLVETMIGVLILAMFMTGVFMLYRSGGQASGQAFWIQKTLSDMRDVTKRLQGLIQKSSYPSTVVFPDGVFENTNSEFALHFSARPVLNATEAKAMAVPGSTPGTQVIRFTEAIPERFRGGNLASQGVLITHVVSLARSGHLLYHAFQENLAQTAAPQYIRGISRPVGVIPPGSLITAKVLLEDVATIRVESTPSGTTAAPVRVEITCRYPRGQTVRSESFDAVPNVGCVARPASGDDW